jgi:hypothetical protein
MIRTLADLLANLRETELKKLAEYNDIQHPGMIGDMYEGLTTDLLQRALFDGLDLRVVTGKMRWSDGRLSRQLDAMVVSGEGEQIPYTDHFIYPLKQLLAVIEVKKSLYGEELADAYENLLTVSGSVDSEPIPVRRVERSFRIITQRELPEDGNLTQLSYELEMTAHTLIRESVLPVRIVLGYSGYASEATLRDGFIRYLEGVVADAPRKGYGPSDFPNLIACGESSLVKLNGMPFAANHSGPAGEWLLYGSLGGRWSHLLLEILWTRLAGQFGLPASIFGDDLEIEQPHPLLFAKPRQEGGVGGWMYREYHLSKKALASSLTLQWEPVPLSNDEAAFMILLCQREVMDTTADPEYLAFARTQSGGVGPFLERLRVEGLAALDESGVLRLLTHECTVAVLPDGSWVAGENVTGRLTRWVLKRVEAASGA